MGLLDSGREWLFRLAAKKAATKILTAWAAWLVAHSDALAGAVAHLDAFGIHVNFTAPDQAAATLALLGAADMGRNLLKTKWPEQFGWL